MHPGRFLNFMQLLYCLNNGAIKEKLEHSIKECQDIWNFHIGGKYINL